MNVIADEIHKPIHSRKYERRKVISLDKDDIWGVDLSDLSKFKKYNNDYTFILFCIDLFTRYAWAIPLKNKESKTISNAFEQIFRKKRIPNFIWMDQGGEFKGETKKLFKKHNIDTYHTYGEGKSVYVERLQRTIKSKMFKIFTENNNNKWIDILDDIIDDYNNTIHSSLNMTPNDASKDENFFKLLDMNAEKYNNYNKKNKFKVGDKVRVSNVKGIFQKGYDYNWSFEIFEIFKVIDSDPYTYKIKDYAGDILEGSFYQEELQKTNQDNDFWLVEEILETKKVKGKKQHLIKWLGYPKKYNSWINDKDLKDVVPNKK